jgi:hypothetical protein
VNIDHGIGLRLLNTPNSRMSATEAKNDAIIAMVGVTRFACSNL